MAPPSPPARGTPHLTALNAAVLYLAIAVLWLVFTEQILQAIVDAAVPLSRAQLLKSIAFMVMTAGLLYGIVRQSLLSERDIQRSLRASERRAAALFNGGSDPVLVFPVGTDGSLAPLIDVNDPACRSLGRGREALLSLPAEAVLSGGALAVLQAIPPGERRMGEGWLLAGDGARVPVEVHACRLVLGEQPVVLATTRDLSARRAAEQALQDSERRYRLLAENANDLIWTLDACGRLDYLSPSAQRLMGADLETIQASPERFARPELEAAIARVRAGQQARAQLEIPFSLPSGALVWLEVCLSELRDAQGRVQGILGISRDISARRAAEIRQHQALQQLHQAQKMEAVGTLAGGVAHDLNNLLAIILGNAEMAAMESSASSKRIARIQMAAERGSALVEKLLLFSRQQPAAAQPTDLNAVITGLLAMVGQLLGAQIAVEVDLDPHIDTVSVDPTQLDQVLLNLAVNARDAMPDGGTLRFETDVLSLSNQEGLPDGRYVRIRVSDTGTGMDADTCARAFEPFFTTKDVGKGTGLGLSTAYGILQEHGGAIRLRSSVGRGTTFSLLLPAIDAAPTNTAAPAPLPVVAPPSASGRRVLVVEDDPLVQGMLVEALSRQGFVAQTARSLAEARGLLVDPGLTLMVCDVVLPDGIGYALPSERPGLPVLMISGYGQEDLAARYPALAGAAPLLRKPFSLQQLSAAIAGLLVDEAARPRPS